MVDPESFRLRRIPARQSCLRHHAAGRFASGEFAVANPAEAEIRRGEMAGGRPWRRILNPGVAMPQDLHHRILTALESVRPCLQVDGGDIELVDVSEDGFVKVHFLGACATCPLCPMTLRAGVERTLMLAFPEVRRVEAVA